MDRDVVNVLARLTSAAEGINQSLGKLASEPLLEIEPAPPQCPHCNKVFPVVVSDEEDIGEVPLGQVVLSGKCKNCDNEIFAVAVTWVVHASGKEAANHALEIMERMGAKPNVENIGTT
jgi:hypothetical protein